MDLVAPRSIVDVGCGSGGWLSAFAAAGVRDLVGLEGSPADPEMIDVEPSQIQACDLSKPFYLDREFGLAVSLEVAEHLPEEAAASFIESLTRLAPVVLFSAAIPGQGGVGHLNEQWPTYWASHFSRNGFEVCDCLRDRVWRDRRVEWWYRQNVLLFVRAQARSNYPRLDQTTLGQAEGAFSAALDRKMPLALRGPMENLLVGDRYTPVSVTAGIASNGGPEKLAVCLRSIAESGFADEIVVCLDRDAPDGSRDAALMFTSRVYDIESEGHFESAQPLLAAHCSGEYLLRLDDDECLAGTWTREGFDGLARMNSITHFLLFRRWIIPPGDLFLSNLPWFPDLQLRLFRNDPRLIVWPDQVHDHMKVGGRGIVMADRFIDHWDLVSSSRPEREKKCARYRAIRPEHDLSYCYLYEDEEIQTLRVDQDDLRSAILASASAPIGPRPAVYDPGEVVDFRSGGNSGRYAFQGWSVQEPWGTWTDGAEADIYFLIEEPLEAGAVLTASVSAFVAPLHPAIRVEVECNGEPIAVWVLDRSEGIEKSAIIRPGIINKGRSLRVCFRIYHPASPYGLGQSADRRLLGLGITTLRVDRI
jgi:SAM-dependent methyltransferase